MANRKALSKSVRFEVLKRDSFTCQYCGAKAPDVLLHVDHVEPVAEGGSNDLLNLVTACVACNAGKGARKLADSSVIEKQRNQLDDLQQRREQIEMMVAWQRGLSDLKDDTVSRIEERWSELAPGFALTDTGRKSLKSWLRNFSVKEILEAMDTSADQYLEFSDGGGVTPDSWNKAFTMVPGIARVSRLSEEDPDIRELYYLRGIMRKRMEQFVNYFNGAMCLDDLRAARNWGVPLSRLRSIVTSARNWTSFRELITEAIEEFKEDKED